MKLNVVLIERGVNFKLFMVEPLKMEKMSFRRANELKKQFLSNNNDVTFFSLEEIQKRYNGKITFFELEDYLFKDILAKTLIVYLI